MPFLYPLQGTRIASHGVPLIASTRRAWLRIRPEHVGAGLLLVAALAGHARAQSCRCPSTDLADIVKRADVILIGRPLTATNDSRGATRDAPGGGWQGGVEFQTRLTFEVARLLKGSSPRFVEVVTPTTACGFHFDVGATYLVAGERRGKVIATDVCRGNVSTPRGIRARADAVRKLLHPAPTSVPR